MFFDIIKKKALENGMSEILTIKEKYKNDFLYTRSGEGCEEFLAPADIEGTYYFKDIVYSDESRGWWKPSAHCSRILNLLCSGGEIKLREDEAFRERMIGALRFWLIKDLRCPNWWFNQISVAGCIASISLLLEPYLDEDMRAGVERIIL